MKNKIFILTVLFGFLFAGTSFAITLYVPGQFSTIQSAIDYAAGHAEPPVYISVARGTYLGFSTWSYNYQESKPIHIFSEEGPEVTIIDGQGCHAVVSAGHCEERDTIIEGFTITGGRIGVSIGGASPTIKNCIITGNTLRGIKIYSPDQWSYSNAHPEIIRNKIIGNGGESYSGGVTIGTNGDDPEPTILQNNIIADNYGTSYGGLYISGNAIATNNTIVGNYSAYQANQPGGVGIGGSVFTSNIVWDNYTVDYYDTSQIVTYENIRYSGGSTTVTYNCIMGGWDGPGEGNVFTNPFLRADYGLDPPSSCIDAGDLYNPGGGVIYYYDFYGNGLYDDNQVENNGPSCVDIGAVENQFDSDWTPWTFYVPDPYPTIQDAIDAAMSGAIIIVGPDTYGPIDLGNKRLTIESTDGHDYTIIDGGGAAYVADLRPEAKLEYIDTVLDGFTIRNGQKAIICSGDKKIIKNNVIDNFPTKGIYLNFSSAEILNNTITNISTDSAGAAINLEDSAVIIKDNIITGNDADLMGGAICIHRPPAANSFEQKPILDSNIIDHNTINENSSSMKGGAMYIAQASAEINNNTITDNISADSGGGLYIKESSIEADNNTISDNQANGPFGGGIYIYDSTATINNSTISNNTSVDSGGGLYFSNATIESTNNLITNNSSGQNGGGLYLDEVELESINNIITTNTAANGGGIYTRGIEDKPFNLINNTIADNIATSSGGGIHVEFHATLQTNLPDIANTIIWGNDAPTDPSIYLQFGAHPEATYSDIETTDGQPWEDIVNNPDTNIFSDPLFIDPATGDYRLGSYTLCIDRADNSVAPGLDQAGNERYDDANMPNIDGSIVDIGALDRQTDSSGEAPTVIHVDIDNTSGIEDGTPENPYNTIQEAINDASHTDTIEVSPGIYVENIDFDGKNIVVKSISGQYVTKIVPFDQYTPAVQFHNGENEAAVLKGFTIKDGRNAISCNGTSPTIKNNIIIDNSGATNGAGIYCYDASPEIINNIIAGNTSALGGAGIYCGGNSSPEIKNCTIVGNTGTGSGSYGGGVKCGTGSSPAIVNTIIYNNTAAYEPQIGTPTSGVPEVSYSDIQDGYVGTGNIQDDPILASDYKLGAFSPCIDAANGDEAPELDLKNNPRYNDPDVANTGVGDPAYVDIGALERQARSRKIKRKLISPR